MRNHIFVLNSVIERKLRNKKDKLYLGFVDFRTAFDSVDREIMIKKLKRMAMKGKFLEMIRKIYRRTKNEVITERFSTGKGVAKWSIIFSLL